VFGFFFLVNASFNGYHGGFAAGPRYLVPGLPFLAFPLVVAFGGRDSLVESGKALPVMSSVLITLMLVLRIWPIGFTEGVVLEAAMIAVFFVLTIAAIVLLPLRQTAMVLLALSIGQHLLLVATDAQNSLAVGGHARIDDAHRKDDFFCDLVGEYAWPLFIQGRAWPVLNQLIEVRVENLRKELEEEG